MEARRRAAALEGSEGRRGFKERGLWRGLEETVDLKNGFEEGMEEAKERVKRDAIWEGILTLTG